MGESSPVPPRPAPRGVEVAADHRGLRRFPGRLALAVVCAASLLAGCQGPPPPAPTPTPPRAALWEAPAPNDVVFYGRSAHGSEYVYATLGRETEASAFLAAHGRLLYVGAERVVGFDASSGSVQFTIPVDPSRAEWSTAGGLRHVHDGTLWLEGQQQDLAGPAIYAIPPTGELTEVLLAAQERVMCADADGFVLAGDFAVRGIDLTGQERWTTEKLGNGLVSVARRGVVFAIEPPHGGAERAQLHLVRGRDGAVIDTGEFSLPAAPTDRAGADPSWSIVRVTDDVVTFGARDMSEFSWTLDVTSRWAELASYTAPRAAAIASRVDTAWPPAALNPASAADAAISTFRDYDFGFPAPAAFAAITVEVHGEPTPLVLVASCTKAIGSPTSRGAPLEFAACPTGLLRAYEASP